MWSGSAVEQALSEVLQTPPASLAWTAEGVSIDSRTLVAGDLFIALRGSNFDGNQYLSAAHQAQATAAIAETLPSGSARALPVFQVKDGLAGLIALAETARDSSSALRLAVTGSSGKTSWRKLLTLALTPLGTIHAAEKSHNNRIGVALTLARLPKSAQLAVTRTRQQRTRRNHRTYNPSPTRSRNHHRTRHSTYRQVRLSKKLSPRKNESSTRPNR